MLNFKISSTADINKLTSKSPKQSPRKIFFSLKVKLLPIECHVWSYRILAKVAKLLGYEILCRGISALSVKTKIILRTIVTTKPFVRGLVTETTFRRFSIFFSVSSASFEQQSTLQKTGPCLVVLSLFPF
jgi:hypothetical protein